jgi:hypothetical protein
MIDSSITRTAGRTTGFAIVATLAVAPTTLTAHGQGGDTPGSCTEYTLGTVEIGTTVGFTDFTDEACPYTGSTSPDVYYCYTPTKDHNLTIELCQSGFDTKVYVYDSTLSLVVDYAGASSCNDDACTSAGGGLFRSLLHCSPMQKDVLYFIVVDGGGGAEGNYWMETATTEDYTGDPGFCLPPPPCPWDLDGDLAVAFQDLLLLLAAWGTCPPGGPCPPDFDLSGSVDFQDLLALLANWGSCPA